MKAYKNTIFRANAVLIPLFVFYVLMLSAAQAQTVFFSTADTGQTKAITQWGHDTAWRDPVNMDNTLTHMGAAEIDVVRLNFYTDEPLTANGEIGPNSKARIDEQLAIAAKAGDKPLALTPSTGDGTHSSYLDSQGNAIPELWVDLLEATQVYIGKTIRSGTLQ